MPSAEPRIAVVGAGVVGATVATEAARRGADVTLFDAGSVASGSSGRAAGICYDAFADRLDAEIAARSLEAFRERGALTDCPYVWLARTGDDRNAGAIRAQVPRMRSNGVAVDLLTADDLADRWPALRADDVAVAAVARDAGLADPATYTRETAQFAVAAGADLRRETPVHLAVDGSVVQGDPADDGPAGRRTASEPDWASHDAVVVAAGAHTGRLLAAAELPVAVAPYRVQAFRTVATPLAEAVPALYDASGGYYLRPWRDGLFVGDGTVPEPQDPTDWDRRADGRFEDAVAGHLETAVGGAVAERRAWAGLCTATPDGDPLVGRRAPGVYVATGLQGHGFMRAPALGERLATLVLADLQGGDADGEGGNDVVDGTGEAHRWGDDWIDAFDPRRFDGDEPVDIVEGMALDPEPP